MSELVLSRRRPLVKFFTAVAVVLGYFIAVEAFAHLAPTLTQKSFGFAALAQDNLDTIDVTSDSVQVVEMTLGNPDATVVLTEYASFTCPHCATFHRDVYPQLKKEYIDTDKVLFRLREVYFDRPGLWASMLARCGGQEKFFGIVDLLFKEQQSWSGLTDSNATVSRLQQIGRAAGLSTEAMNACFRDQDKAESLVETWRTNQAADDISATPTLIINGVSHGNKSYNDLANLLDEALGS